jgi:hypothetical protein
LSQAKKLQPELANGFEDVDDDFSDADDEEIFSYAAEKNKEQEECDPEDSTVVMSEDADDDDASSFGSTKRRRLLQDLVRSMESMDVSTKQKTEKSKVELNFPRCKCKLVFCGVLCSAL